MSLKSKFFSLVFLTATLTFLFNCTNPQSTTGNKEDVVTYEDTSSVLVYEESEESEVEIVEWTPGEDLPEIEILEWEPKSQVVVKNEAGDGEGELYVRFNKNSMSIGGLAKSLEIKIPRDSFANLRIDSVTHMLVRLTDTSDSSVSDFNLGFNASGVVDEVIVVPYGVYSAVFYLTHSQVPSWDDSYMIRDFAFETRDTIDLSAGGSYTANLLFREIIGLPFFIKMLNPPGSYTNDTKYLTSKSTVSAAAKYAYYLNDTLMFWVYSGNIDGNTAFLNLKDDTGMVRMRMKYNLTMVDIRDDWTLLISPGDIKVGSVTYEHKSSLVFDYLKREQGWLQFHFSTRSATNPDSLIGFRSEVFPDTFSIKKVSDSTDITGSKQMNIGFFASFQKFGQEMQADSTYRITLGVHTSYWETCDTTFLFTVPLDFYGP